jgi:hypothetical protein
MADQTQQEDMQSRLARHLAEQWAKERELGVTKITNPGSMGPDPNGEKGNFEASKAYRDEAKLGSRNDALEDNLKHMAMTLVGGPLLGGIAKYASARGAMPAVARAAGGAIARGERAAAPAAARAADAAEDAYVSMPLPPAGQYAPRPVGGEITASGRVGMGGPTLSAPPSAPPRPAAISSELPSDYQMRMVPSNGPDMWGARRVIPEGTSTQGLDMTEKGDAIREALSRLRAKRVDGVIAAEDGFPMRVRKATGRYERPASKDTLDDLAPLGEPIPGVDRPPGGVQPSGVGTIAQRRRRAM